MNEAYKKPETEDDKLESQLALKIEENNWTAEELNEAYFLLCGIGDTPTSERIGEIKNLMDGMTAKQYPLNRFVKIISSLGEWEDSGIQFINFVDTLPITQAEKDVLKSIVEHNRAGELACTINGLEVARLRIQPSASTTGTAYALRTRLSEILAPLAISGQKADISFWFEEQ